MRKSVAAAAVAGSLLAGAGAGAILFGPLSAGAQSTTTTTPSADSKPDGRADHGRRHEAVSDLSVAATAIGISEADLKTALGGGQSLAAVAKAHDVDPQKVIDALVADAKSELDAAVKAGDLTQTQADAKSADLPPRITDQVNGTFKGGHGPGG